MENRLKPFLDGAREYDSGNIYEASRPISNEEGKSSNNHAPTGRGTRFDKRKFKQ